MSDQLPIGGLATPHEQARARALELTHGRGYWTLEEALDLARPGWREAGFRLIDPKTYVPNAPGGAA